MSGFKSGFVVIVGRPNVGKSTLMNHLIGQKVAITSKKPQTTRNRIETVLTTEEGQIIFLDTPGMLRKAKNRLGAYMMEVSSGTLEEADVVLFLVEPSSYIGEGDREIAEKLKGTRTPVILVINKIDTIEKTKILEIIAAYRKLMDFAEIVPVSALRDQNLDDLKTTVLKYLPEGPMYFDADTLTDQPMRQIAAEVIREKALHALDKEIPHGIAVMIERFAEEGSLTSIEAVIVCEKESHKGIIIGKGGAMLKKIGMNARYELKQMLGTRVFLKLFVKVRTNWRDSEVQLKNFGYEKQS